MFFFFFNDTATTEIYTLSLHDALPIWATDDGSADGHAAPPRPGYYWACPAPVLACGATSCCATAPGGPADRKSTRLNSSHANISYAVFCLKKKKKTQICQHDSHHQ